MKKWILFSILILTVTAQVFPNTDSNDNQKKEIGKILRRAQAHRKFKTYKARFKDTITFTKSGLKSKGYGRIFIKNKKTRIEFRQPFTQIHIFEDKIHSVMDANKKLIETRVDMSVNFNLKDYLDLYILKHSLKDDGSIVLKGKRINNSATYPEKIKMVFDANTYLLQSCQYFNNEGKKTIKYSYIYHILDGRYLVKKEKIKTQNYTQTRNFYAIRLDKKWDDRLFSLQDKGEVE